MLEKAAASAGVQKYSKISGAKGLHEASSILKTHKY
jgi:DNA primase